MITLIPSADTLPASSEPILPQPMRPQVCPRNRCSGGIFATAQVSSRASAIAGIIWRLSIKQKRERVVGNFVEAIVRNVRHQDAALGRRRDVDRVHADSVAHDDAAALHGGNRALRDRRPHRQHAVRVPAQLRDLVFVHRLPRDQRAARGFHRAPLLLDVRKAVIGDDDLQVPPLLFQWRTLQPVRLLL